MAALALLRPMTAVAEERAWHPTPGARRGAADGHWRYDLGRSELMTDGAGALVSLGGVDAARPQQIGGGARRVRIGAGDGRRAFGRGQIASGTTARAGHSRRRVAQDRAREELQNLRANDRWLRRVGCLSRRIEFRERQVMTGLAVGRERNRLHEVAAGIEPMTVGARECLWLRRPLPVPTIAQAGVEMLCV